MLQPFHVNKFVMSGQFVKETLEGLGFGLSELARRLGVTPQTLSERLVVKDMKLGMLAEIASVVGKDEYFFIDRYKELNGQKRALQDDKATIPTVADSSLAEMLRLKDEIIDAQRKTIKAYEKMLAEKGKN